MFLSVCRVIITLFGYLRCGQNPMLSEHPCLTSRIITLIPYVHHTSHNVFEPVRVLEGTLHAVARQTCMVAEARNPYPPTWRAHGNRHSLPYPGVLALPAPMPCFTVQLDPGDSVLGQVSSQLWTSIGLSPTSFRASLTSCQYLDSTHTKVRSSLIMLDILLRNGHIA